jgi:hypothetical protein
MSRRILLTVRPHKAFRLWEYHQEEQSRAKRSRHDQRHAEGLQMQ